MIDIEYTCTQIKMHIQKPRLQIAEINLMKYNQINECVFGKINECR